LRRFYSLWVPRSVLERLPEESRDEVL
jgi:hypothetical protein